MFRKCFVLLLSAVVVGFIPVRVVPGNACSGSVPLIHKPSPNAELLLQTAACNRQWTRWSLCFTGTSSFLAICILMGTHGKHQHCGQRWSRRGRAVRGITCPPSGMSERALGPVLSSPDVSV